MDYQYDPLPDPRTYIRLLQILEGSTTQPVECVLTSWTLDTAPPYCAISYTWGDPSETSELLINKKQSIVRRNCEYALQQAYASGADTYLWVDALCIDQTNTEEKNYQVALMGNLYEQATRVFACVGPHADDSDFLMDLIQSRWPFFHELYQEVKPNELFTARDWTGNPPKLEKPVFFQPGELQVGLILMRGRIAKALIQFLKRPYFSRVWILQELYSGNGKITICCGMDEQPLGAILALDLLVQQWADDRPVPKLLANTFEMISRILSFHANTPQHIPFDRPTQHEIHDQVPQRGCLSAGAAPNSKPCKLRRVVRVLARFKCENPIDKIYGVGSLIDWPEGAAPFPDYAKDRVELAIEILELLHLSGAWDDIEWYQSPMIALARRVRTLLDLSLDQSALRKAIHSRQVAPTTNDENPHGRLKRPRQGEVRWYGTMLGENFISRQRNTFSEICTLDHGIVAYGPKDTQLGDWWIIYVPETENMHPKRYSNFWDERSYTKLEPDAIGLVIRYRASGVYEIIGPTFPANIYARKTIPLPGVKFFAIWWDAEDLLVLEWRISHYNVHSRPSEQKDMYSGLRVCASDAPTSYAKGPHDPITLRASLDEDRGASFLEKMQWTLNGDTLEWYLDYVDIESDSDSD